MTDEERKQFINEYCRNVGNIKIRCDDCKFVENCVDYGWQGCRKFTPKPNEPMTNEEYLKSLDTEQLAKRLHDKDVYAFFVCRNGGKVPSVEHYVEWLKEKHE